MNVKELIETLKLFNQEAEVKLKIQHNVGNVLLGKLDHAHESTNPIQLILISENE